MYGHCAADDEEYLIRLLMTYVTCNDRLVKRYVTLCNMYAGRLHTGQGYARETAETPREHPEWHRGMMASCRRRTLFAPNWYEQDRQRGTTERRYAVARALVPLLLSGQITQQHLERGRDITRSSYGVAILGSMRFNGILGRFWELRNWLPHLRHRNAASFIARGGLPPRRRSSSTVPATTLTLVSMGQAC